MELLVGGMGKAPKLYMIMDPSKGYVEFTNSEDASADEKVLAPILEMTGITSLGSTHPFCYDAGNPNSP
jgi:hypothetical protein